MINADQIGCFSKRPIRYFEVGRGPRDVENGVGVPASDDRAKALNAIEVVFKYQEELHLATTIWISIG